MVVLAVVTEVPLLIPYGCFISLNGCYIFQVSLREPLRRGADDNELTDIIGAAVSRDYYEGLFVLPNSHYLLL